jgi:hypothetical protein
LWAGVWRPGTPGSPWTRSSEYAGDPKALKLLHKSVEHAAQNTTEHIFHKIAATDDGKPRIADHPPLLFHPDRSELDMERDVRPFFESYRATLSPDREVLLGRDRVGFWLAFSANRESTSARASRRRWNGSAISGQSRHTSATVTGRPAPRSSSYRRSKTIRFESGDMAPL